MNRTTLRRLFLALAAVLAAAGIGHGQAPQTSGTPGIAVLGAIEGPIGPATVRHVEKLVEAARERRAKLLILRLDTPGGLATSMRKVISTILASPVPVAGWVAPPGAHAASAGTYILYATHVAAMAPGTNLGAATPVQIGGGIPGLPKPKEDEKKGAEDDKAGSKPDAGDKPSKSAPLSGGDAMTHKVTNDAIALIRSLAEMHGRNAEWAESAVREAASLSARKAAEIKVIDFVAPDVGALLEQADGRRVIAGSAEIVLATKDLRVETVEADFVTSVLGLLSNPNVAFILMIVGVYGLIFEFSNPGSIGPGVVGTICLLLGLYALNQLPLNYAGLALVIFGIAFMAAEAVTPSFGALGAGGIVAFVIGSAMLIDTDAPAYQLSWWVIGGMAAASGGMLILLLGYLWRVYRRVGPRDETRMVGADGTVLDWADGAGHVWAEGERWTARGAADFRQDDHVRIRGMEGLTLIVDAPADGAAGGDTATVPEAPEKGD